MAWFFGPPRREWRGVVVGVPTLNFPLRDFPGQASFPSLRNGRALTPNGIVPRTQASKDQAGSDETRTDQIMTKTDPSALPTRTLSARMPLVQFADPSDGVGSHPERLPTQPSSARPGRERAPTRSSIHRPPSARSMAASGMKDHTQKKLFPPSARTQPAQSSAGIDMTKAPPPIAASEARAKAGTLSSGSSRARVPSARLLSPGQRPASARLSAQPATPPSSASCGSLETGSARKKGRLSAAPLHAHTGTDVDKIRSPVEASRLLLPKPKAATSESNTFRGVLPHQQHQMPPGAHSIAMDRKVASTGTMCQSQTSDVVQRVARHSFLIRKGFDDEIGLDVGSSLILWRVVIGVVVILIGAPAAVCVLNRALPSKLIQAYPTASGVVVLAYLLALVQLWMCIPYLFHKVMIWQQQQQQQQFQRLHDLESATSLESVCVKSAAPILSSGAVPKLAVSPRTQSRRDELSLLLDGYSCGKYSKVCRFSAEHLKTICQKTNVGDFKALGFSMDDLERLGLSVTRNGLQPTNLKALGYSAAELRAASFSASDLRHLGFTAAELRVTGCDASALKKAGFRLVDLKAALFTAAELLDLKFTSVELKRVGFLAAELLTAGASASELRQLGYSVTEMMAAGVDIGGLKDAGYHAAECVRAMFSVEELRSGGYSATELRTAALCAPSHLRAAGYTLDELREAGYTVLQLCQCGFSVTELKDSAVGQLGAIDPAELVRANLSADQLRCGGFSLSDLVTDRAPEHLRKLHDIGFTCSEFHDVGCTAKDLKNAGLSTEELWATGYGLPELCACGATAQELHKIGLTEKQLRSIGYTAEDLFTGGLSALKLKQAGFSLKELKEAGCRVKELKAVGFKADELRAVGYKPEGLREGGFTVRELKYQGINASELKSAGFTWDELRDGGFTEEVLGTVGFQNRAAAIKIQSFVRGRRSRKSNSHSNQRPAMQQAGQRVTAALRQKLLSIGLRNMNTDT